MKKPIVEKLKPLFYPKSVAVIGASHNPARWGFSIFNDLLVKGFKGDLYPINKNEERISEIRCSKSVKDILKPVDLAVIAVPAKIVRARKFCVAEPENSKYIIPRGSNPRYSRPPWARRIQEAVNSRSELIFLNDLLLGATDTAMKEKRPVVLAIRKMPLSAIHLRNMLELSDIGVTILPGHPLSIINQKMF